MYRIGLFSKICHVSIKTLRYYDEIGLLTPAYINQENGYRFYSSEQLVAFQRIASLRQLGFSIAEIFAIIHEQNVTALLTEKKSELARQIQEASDQLSRIDHYLQEYQKEAKMKQQPVIKTLPECIVYSKRFITPNFDSYLESIPQIGKDIKKVNPNLVLATPAYCFIMYHDTEYKDRDMDIELCEAVTEFGTETAGITFKKIPSVSAVAILHKGSYQYLKDVYIYLFKWIEDNDYIIIAPPRESYIDGIWNKENEADWLTEIQVPVTKK